jgi:hypothetical protein
MRQWKNIASVAALSISTALAGTGCLAQGTGEETANEQETTPAVASDRQGEEKTGEASQACGLGFCFNEDCIPFRRFGFTCGCGWGFGGFDGCEVPGFGFTPGCCW